MPGPLVFSAWSFTNDHGAQRALHPLVRSEAPDLRVIDAAVLCWPTDQRRPQAWQERDIGGTGSLSGAFWGLLVSSLFLLPLSAPDPPHLNADAELARPLDRSLEHLGLDAAFVAAVRCGVEAGTSALLILDASTTTDALAAAMPATARLIARRSLSTEHEANLRAAFEE